MGTALTRSHLDLLFRQVPKLVLCFDGDAAGRRAAWRSIEQALPVMQGMREVRVLFLPEGDDPDSLVRREGLDGWRERLDGASVLSETLMRLLAERHPLQTAEGRSRFAHEAVTLIRSVTDPLFRGQLSELVAEQTHSPAARIETMLDDDGEPRPTRSPARTASAARANSGAPSQLWGALLARMVQLPQCPWDAAEIQRLAETDTRAARILSAILERIATVPNISTARLLEHFRDESFFERLAALASLPLGDESPELSMEIALDSAERLFREYSRDRLRSLSAAARPLTPEEIQELKRLQTTLSRKGRTG
jgi:DNA primase